MARSQRGATFVELLAVTVVLTMGLMLSTQFAHTWIQRQSARSAVYHVQSGLRLCRVQAIARNNSCRFVINDASRRIQVFDLNDPLDSTDDVELADLTLSSVVSFNRPDAGDPITLSPLSATEYQATFNPQGNVTEGVGEVVLQGVEDQYHRVSLFGAGGIALERWNGSAWAEDL